MDTRNMRGERRRTVLGIPLTKRNFEKICERLTKLLIKILIAGAICVGVGLFFKGMSDVTKVTGGFWHGLWWFTSTILFVAAVILFVIGAILGIRKIKISLSRFVGELRDDDDDFPRRDEFTPRHNDESSYDDFWDTEGQDNPDNPDNDWDSLMDL